MRVIGNLDLNLNELRQLVLELLTIDPSGAELVDARLWWNSTEQVIKYFNGAQVHVIGTAADVAALQAALDAEIVNRTNADALIRSDMASNAVNKGSSLIGVQDVAGYFVNTNVETVLKEIHEYTVTVDTAIKARAANLEGALGTTTGLPGLNFTSVNYVTAGTSAKQSISTLDAQLKIANDTVAALDLQTIYNQTGKDGAGAAGITLTTGKDFRIYDDTNAAVFFQIDSETGAITITGDLIVSGTTSTVNSTISDADHWMISPSAGTTTAFDINPDLGVLMATDIFRIRATNDGVPVVRVDADGVTHILDWNMQTVLSNHDTHIAGTGLKHNANVIVYSNAVSTLVATETQAAIDELDVKINDNNSTLYTEASVLRTFVGSLAANDVDPLYSSTFFIMQGTNLTSAASTLDLNLNRVENDLNTESSNRTNADTLIRNDIASVLPGKGASLVGISGAFNIITTSNVNAALVNLDSQVKTNIDNITSNDSDILKIQGALGTSGISLLSYGSNNFVTDATNITSQIGVLDAALQQYMDDVLTPGVGGVTPSPSGSSKVGVLTDGYYNSVAGNLQSVLNDFDQAIFAAGKRAQMVATVANTTFTFTHNLGYEWCVVTVFDTVDRQVVIPDSIVSVDANTVTVTFTQPIIPVIKVVA